MNIDTPSYFYTDCTIQIPMSYQMLLPNEVLANVFNFLQVEEAVSARLAGVCYQFYIISKEKQLEISVHLEQVCYDIISFIEDSYYFRKNWAIFGYCNEPQMPNIQTFSFDFTCLYQTDIQKIALQQNLINGKRYPYLPVIKPSSNEVLFYEKIESECTEVSVVYRSGKIAVTENRLLKNEIQQIAKKAVSTINRCR